MIDFLKDAYNSLIGSDIYTNDNEIYRMPMIGEAATSFKANTTQGEINFPEDYAGKWVIFFSHPSDFTPVCTTEFITFAMMQDEFKELNTELVGLSVDSIYSHIAWLRTIRDKIKWKGLKNMEVKFPLIADVKMEVAKKYGMIQPNQSTTQAVRAVFIVDPNGIIRAIIYYPLSTGRNFDELKRLIMALQKTDEKGIATPADWRPGDDVIIPPATDMETANKRMRDLTDNIHCLDWFMCFKKDN